MSDPILFGLIAFWLGFASHHSGLPIPPTAPMPQVRVVSSATINAHPNPCGEEYAGVTDMRTGVISLSADQSGEDRECTLAHELTHYLQFVNHVPLRDLETAAYKVTGACYAQHFHVHEQWSSEMVSKHAGGRCQG